MILDEAKEVLKIEAQGILDLMNRIGDEFVRMTDLIYKASGRVIVTGIGKSGLIGRKIVATLNSTGTRAFFLHPVEAMHGDLGMVGNDDVCIALSYSGKTDELNILLQSIRNIGCPIIAFTGDKGSPLAKSSDIVIDVSVEKEACPMGLAPTASSTAQLAMGDALAVALMHKNQFRPDDYKKFHPGGALGQRLAENVDNLMQTGDAVPAVYIGTGLRKAIAEIDRLSLGAALVLRPDGTLAGIFTDGDLRRIVAKNQSVDELTVDDVMSENPKNVVLGSPAYDALNLMERFQITVLPITDAAGKVKGILHLHEILGKGDFKFNGANNA